MQSTDALMFPSFNPDKTYFQHQKDGLRSVEAQENYDISTLRLTAACSASELLSHIHE